MIYKKDPRSLKESLYLFFFSIFILITPVIFYRAIIEGKQIKEIGMENIVIESISLIILIIFLIIYKELRPSFKNWREAVISLLKIILLMAIIGSFCPIIIVAILNIEVSQSWFTWHVTTFFTSFLIFAIGLK